MALVGHVPLWSKTVDRIRAEHQAIFSAVLAGDRNLAARLVAADVEVVSSLAGDVAAPLLPAGKVRIGGFGGVHGLAGYLRASGADASPPALLARVLEGGSDV